MIYVPEYAKPAIGYAMHHLTHCERDQPEPCKPDTVWEMLNAHKSYGHFSDELKKRIMCQALRNVSASEAARNGSAKLTLQQCFDGCDCYA